MDRGKKKDRPAKPGKRLSPAFFYVLIGPIGQSTALDLTYRFQIEKVVIWPAGSRPIVKDRKKYIRIAKSFLERRQKGRTDRRRKPVPASGVAGSGRRQRTAEPIHDTGSMPDHRGLQAQK